jgi:hypothetical protein
LSPRSFSAWFGFAWTRLFSSNTMTRRNQRKFDHAQRARASRGSIYCHP